MNLLSQKKLKTLTIVFCFILPGFTCLMAAPASPGFFKIKQPDGTHFFGQQKGDEWFNWTETQDKNVVIRNKNTGYYEYAVIKKENNRGFLAPSGVKVKEIKTDLSPSQRSLEPIQQKDLSRLRKEAIEDRKQFK